VLDRDWRYVFINQAGAALFGRTPADLIGKHIWTEFPEGVGQPFHQAYERAMRTQQPEVFEDHYEPWDRWFENRIYPSPEALSIFYHEITDRKRQEIALRETSGRLAAIIQGTQTGLWDWDLRTNKVRFSREWKAQLGYADAEIGDDFDEWQRRVHPEDLERALERVRRFLASPAPGFENEFRMRHKDGAYRWILARAHVLPGVDGAPERMIGVHLDITQRKSEQLLLEAQNRVLEMVARGAPIDTVLEDLVRSMESLAPGSIGSVLLLDDDGVHVRHAAAPSLPAEFVAAIDGQPIGERAGSCGTAMYRRQAVIVEDITTDPLWDEYRDTAMRFGLRACWSTPILDEGEGALGSFALYWKEPRRPELPQLRAGALAAHVAAIALRRSRQANALRASEAYARRLFEQANDAIHVVGADGRLLDVNERAVEMLGCSRTDLLRMTMDDIVPAEQRARLAPPVEQVVGSEPNVVEGILLRRDGARLPVEISYRRLDDVTFRAVIRDLTERKRAERALKKSFQQIRKLAIGLERAREAERARIARELHDELGQVLTGIKMDLAWIDKRLPDADAAVRERVAITSKLLDEAVTVGRRIASELRPGVLDDLGLGPALKWLARDFGQRSALSVSVSVPDDLVVDDERATAAFRIAQEALTNVSRHAGATHLELRARVEDDTLCIDIVDNGRGMPAEKAETDTLGVLGMRERAATWSGTLEIGPAPGGGTWVQARIPLGPRG